MADLSVSEIGRRLETWSLADDSLSDSEIKELLLAVIDLVNSESAAATWRSIPEHLALALLDLDGDTYGWPLKSLAPVLDRIQVLLSDVDSLQSYCRALRMLAGPAPLAVIEQYCQDLLSEEIDRYADALASVKGVWKSGDIHAKAAIEKLLRELAPNDSRRTRLEARLHDEH